MKRIVLAPEQLDSGLELAPVPPARVACPRCGSRDHLKTEVDGAGYGFLTFCDNCYDVDCSGDPPAFRATTEQGWGRTRAESCFAWNDAVEVAD